MTFNQIRRLTLCATITATVAGTFISPAHALSESQSKGMFRHGIWEWSLNNCPNAMRQNGYWYALKEVGGFKNINQIVTLEGGKDFMEGWKYMTSNGERFGIVKTCDYAFEQWPAVLYKNEE